VTQAAVKLGLFGTSRPPAPYSSLFRQFRVPKGVEKPIDRSNRKIAYFLEGGIYAKLEGAIEKPQVLRMLVLLPISLSREYSELKPVSLLGFLRRVEFAGTDFFEPSRRPHP
jgi:hypothetical protein